LIATASASGLSANQPNVNTILDFWHYTAGVVVTIAEPCGYRRIKLTTPEGYPILYGRAMNVAS